MFCYIYKIKNNLKFYYNLKKYIFKKIYIMEINTQTPLITEKVLETEKEKKKSTIKTKKKYPNNPRFNVNSILFHILYNNIWNYKNIYFEQRRKNIFKNNNINNILFMFINNINMSL